MFCEECGKKLIRPQALYCPYCGHKVNHGSDTNAVPEVSAETAASQNAVTPETPSAIEMSPVIPEATAVIGQETQPQQEETPAEPIAIAPEEVPAPAEIAQPVEEPEQPEQPKEQPQQEETPAEPIAIAPEETPAPAEPPKQVEEPEEEEYTSTASAFTSFELEEIQRNLKKKITVEPVFDKEKLAAELYNNLYENLYENLKENIKREVLKELEEEKKNSASEKKSGFFKRR